MKSRTPPPDTATAPAQPGKREGIRRLVTTAFTLAMTISSLSSIFSDYLQWSKFFTVAIRYYHIAVYPFYDFLGNLLHISIPTITRDIYSICYSLAACLFFARGFEGGLINIARMMWSASDSVDLETWNLTITQRIIFAILGSFVVAALAPGLLLLIIAHPKTRPLGLDALRIYAYGLIAFVALAAIAFYAELMFSQRDTLSLAANSVVTHPAVVAVLLLNAALLVGGGIGALVFTLKTKGRCVMILSKAAGYQIRARDGIIALVTTASIAKNSRYVVPRLNGELDIFFENGFFIRLGDVPKAMGRGAFFSAHKMVLVEMRGEDMVCAAVLPVAQRHRLLGIVLRSHIRALPDPKLATTYAELGALEPQFRKKFVDAKEWDSVQ